MKYTLEALLPVVAELSEKYTAFESTSITYEKAQSLMGAVIYCLDEYQNASPEAPVSREVPIREQYQRGYELVLEKVQKTLTLFNQMSARFDDFGVHNLRDTIQKWIPAFLKWYDARFCPQNIRITLDYPLLTGQVSAQGIDAVYEYLYAIRTEQLFLCKIDRNYLLCSLEKYNSDYSRMLENICEIVLPGILAHLALARPFDDTGFDSHEYMQLAERFGNKSVSDIEQIILRLLHTLAGKYDNNGPEIFAYLSAAARNIAVRTDTAVRFGQLEKLFIW